MNLLCLLHLILYRSISLYLAKGRDEKYWWWKIIGKWRMKQRIWYTIRLLKCTNVFHSVVGKMRWFCHKKLSLATLFGTNWSVGFSIWPGIPHKFELHWSNLFLRKQLVRAISWPSMKYALELNEFYWDDSNSVNRLIWREELNRLSNT